MLKKALTHSGQDIEPCEVWGLQLDRPHSQRKPHVYIDRYIYYISKSNCQQNNINKYLKIYKKYHPNIKQIDDIKKQKLILFKNFRLIWKQTAIDGQKLTKSTKSCYLFWFFLNKLIMIEMLHAASRRNVKVQCWLQFSVWGKRASCVCCITTNTNCTFTCRKMARRIVLFRSAWIR